MRTTSCCLGMLMLVLLSCTPEPSKSTSKPVSDARDRTVSGTDEQKDVGVPIWGEDGPWEPEYHPAADVPSTQVDLIRAAHAIATEAWGNFGPVEYWIIGNDVDAAVEHDIYFCTVRREKDPGLPPDFERHCLNRDYNFEDYARDGGAGLNTRRSKYEDYSVFLVSFGSKYPSPDEVDYTVVAYHEYFHVVQNAKISTRNEEERGLLMVENPWWSEGGAEYMAQLLHSRQPGVDAGYLRERMRWKMQSKSSLPGGKRFNEIPYGEHARAAYDLGTWFIAFLIDRVGEEAYRVDFYEDLEELGWEGSFQANFGMPSEEMLEEFEVFLARPLHEQLAIIP